MSISAIARASVEMNPPVVTSNNELAEVNLVESTASATSPKPDVSATSTVVDPEKALYRPDGPPATMLSKCAQLQAHLQTLTTLQAHVSNLRKLPMHLLALQPQSAILPLGLGLGLDDGVLGGSGVGSSSSERDDLVSILNPGSTKGAQAHNVFRVLKETQHVLLSHSTQSALSVAKESEKLDKSDLSKYSRRERKKRRTANADSPAPFPTFQLQTTSAFPRSQGTSAKVENMTDLHDFIREHRRNSKRLEAGSRGSTTTLSIWAHSRSKRQRVPSPLTIRVAIQDVTTVYLKMLWKLEDRNDRLSVESLVALGPREKKSPHSHSDYTVYQKLTQQITRMIEQEPSASFPQIIDLLTSYEDLFITRCSVCERVLSQEGHIPPVARIWVEKSSTGDLEIERGRWDARHISCLHE